MKFALVVVVAAFAVFQIVNAQSNNISWGNREAGDKQLYRDIVVKKGSFLQIVTKDVEFRSQNRITFINCTDQYTNGDGGYATLYEGGPGYGNVKIHLKSQRGHGINFIVEVFGV